MPYCFRACMTLTAPNQLAIWLPTTTAAAYPMLVEISSVGMLELRRHARAEGQGTTLLVYVA